MATAKTPKSSSVCIQFEAQQGPKDMESAMAIVGRYGEVGRIDMTRAKNTGRVTVTYFDTRHAQKAVDDLPGAELAPQHENDFNAVSVSAMAFAELPAVLQGGFQEFGEIADVSVCGVDMIVQFHDMRAAAQVLLKVPSSKPHKPHCPDSSDAESSTCTAPPPGLTLPTKAEQMAEATATNSAIPVPNVTPAGPGKPAREKVDSKDLSKFDIDPEAIKSGEDTRTTVMIRNVPKNCTSEELVEQLGWGGLTDRYSFFYMPFDNRRKGHAGCAFVNFKTPQDVLQLHLYFQTVPWLTLISQDGRRTKPLAVSYGRIQGQEDLVRHFSVSAVIHDKDVAKRPMFLDVSQQCQESWQEMGMWPGLPYNNFVFPGVEEDGSLAAFLEGGNLESMMGNAPAA